jgi:hypothetical protein
LKRVSNPHLSFGAGAHFCIGNQLARLEGQVAILKLPYRVPIKRVLDVIVRDGRKGYHPRQIAAVIYKAITVDKPRARYSVVPKPLEAWLLTRVFPVRLIDRLMAKQFGLEQCGRSSNSEGARISPGG